jgi:urease accessory protein
MLTFTERLPPRHTASPPPPETVVFSLLLHGRRTHPQPLSSRQSRRFFPLFRLPRGTILQDCDFLRGENGEIVQIIAKPEPVITITAPSTDSTPQSGLSPR